MSVAALFIGQSIQFLVVRLLSNVFTFRYEPLNIYIYFFFLLDFKIAFFFLIFLVSRLHSQLCSKRLCCRLISTHLLLRGRTVGKHQPLEINFRILDANKVDYMTGQDQFCQLLMQMSCRVG